MLQNALILAGLMCSAAAESVKNAAKRYNFRLHPGIVTPKRVLSKWENCFYTSFTMGNAAKHVKSASINAFRSEYILIFYAMGTRSTTKVQKLQVTINFIIIKQVK